MPVYQIKIFKESAHFNAAHFTIFENARERLHGHDYFLSIKIESQLNPKYGVCLNYSELKFFLSRITHELDEYLLLPKLSPKLLIQKNGDNIEFYYNKIDFYSIPEKDVKLLPLVNISSECLLEWSYEKLIEIWNPLPSEIIAIELELSNGKGQSVSRLWRIK
jgi:6-pyruvoyltetrahydropterin/6-carboxytetrahydropterin synthase